MLVLVLTLCCVFLIRNLGLDLLHALGYSLPFGVELAFFRVLHGHVKSPAQTYPFSSHFSLLLRWYWGLNPGHSPLSSVLTLCLFLEAVSRVAWADLERVLFLPPLLLVACGSAVHAGAAFAPSQGAWGLLRLSVSGLLSCCVWSCVELGLDLVSSFPGQLPSGRCSFP